VGKKKEDVKIVTSGAGAAAIAITKLLLSAGFRGVGFAQAKIIASLFIVLTISVVTVFGALTPFPGIFRGAFDVRASDINEEMKVAAAEALAGLVGDELCEDYIIPAAFDPRVGPAVAKAVAEAARRSGVARL